MILHSSIIDITKHKLSKIAFGSLIFNVTNAIRVKLHKTHQLGWHNSPNFDGNLRSWPCCDEIRDKILFYFII